MLLLSLDTATALATACLLEDGRIRAELTLRAPSPQQSDHLALVDTVLRSGGVTLKEVDAFACAIGPGGFTGLRVGLSLLKGFTCDGSRPLFPVSSLAALARTAGPFDGLVIPCFDARRGEVYAAGYHGADTVIEECVLPPADISARVAALGNRPSLWLGEGARVYRDILAADGRHFAGELFESPRGAAVAVIAWEAWQRGDRPQADLLVPTYIRASEAERNAGSKKRV